MTDHVTALLDELDLEEKVSLVHGAIDPAGTATGYLPGVERLDIPPLRLVDGPVGVRIPGRKATAFPASLALAASFDPSLGREQGAAMGREANAHDQDVLLGPGTNIVRVPHCGRNFEYFSEDPVHSLSFARAVVEGIQSEDVLACVKHYVANNQETNRTTVDVAVDERTLRELYLPAFRAAVDAGVGSVMAAYNAVDGTPMSEHERLLRGVLKDEWGFDGFVTSDWFGTEDAVRSATGGLDVEMPGISGEAFAALVGMDDGENDQSGESDGGMPDMANIARFEANLAAAIEAGDVPRERLDDMVARVLTGMKRIGRLDGERPEGSLDAPAHRTLAERIAVRGTVLLANDGVLPLDDDADVALVGSNVDTAILGGGGSSEVTPFVRSSPADGVTERADGDVTVAHGLPPIADPSFFDATTSEDGETAASDDRSIDDAVEAARGADTAVVFVRDRATEARDRPDLRLPGEQDDLIEAVAEATDRTVVVINSSGPVELPWREEVGAIIENWYPGQAHGDAIASVLYGDSDPGGRLPVTFAAESAYPTATTARFPGEGGVVKYTEGRLVGYRHFEATEHEAVYPFGHGRSYAAFAYRDAEQVDGSTVRVTVENTSSRAGREVVQAYVRSTGAGRADEPRRELAGFASVRVPAGESVAVDIDLHKQAFVRYGDDGWRNSEGPFVVDVARSATDRRLSVDLRRE
ncbi:beta-hexosaminidase [Halalkalicoccus paucihalophilus]|uniref:Beta-hexosaminidase n=1 Tax=Halalkalicoccus paucihalophilus TaxID=1008153 RepID=A0A151AFT4_9EURY|nr:glycoside hydrolase family 3 C-terminal domain-containing protein [Halalkalicoccus paucihalophilus]KYH26412.1 beta-hexosaminidase [Halalkalicoccus paucihalophilus]